MHSLKTPAFLRHSSRPSSPLPTQVSSGRSDSENAIDSRPTSQLTKALTLTSFSRKPSPAPVRPSTPVPLVQDGSFLESLGLRLSDAVTKALIQPPGSTGTTGNDVLYGKRPIPADRGKALGELIAA